MTYLRTSVTALVLVGGIFATHSFRPIGAAGLQRPLREFPSAIGVSHSEDRPFEKDVVQAIGADDYINRVYVGSAPPIELYIGYYKDQRSGDKNSLSQELSSGLRMGASPFHPRPDRFCGRGSRTCKRIPGGTGSQAGYGPLLVPVAWTDRCERILG